MNSTVTVREEVKGQIVTLDDATLDALRTLAHTDRSNLVNLYLGEDRKERIAEQDLIIGIIEEEQAERAGLASSEDILASFPGTVVEDAAHLAYLLDVDEEEQAPEAEPERILWDTKIFGAAVTLIAQNPRTVPNNVFVPEQGTTTEWDLIDGDGTEYGNVRGNEHSTLLAFRRRMARVARAYWSSH